MEKRKLVALIVVVGLGVAVAVWIGSGKGDSVAEVAPEPVASEAAVQPVAQAADQERPAEDLLPGEVRKGWHVSGVRMPYNNPRSMEFDPERADLSDVDVTDVVGQGMLRLALSRASKLGKLPVPLARQVAAASRHAYDTHPFESVKARATAEVALALQTNPELANDSEFMSYAGPLIEAGKENLAKSQGSPEYWERASMSEMSKRGLEAQIEKMSLGELPVTEERWASWPDEMKAGYIRRAERNGHTVALDKMAEMEARVRAKRAAGQ